MADYTDTLAVFPAALSTAATDMPQHADGDVVAAAHMNQAQAEIIKIEAALGTNPQGGAASVGARIAGIESSVGTLNSHDGAATGVHGVGTGNVVGTDLAQTLTNKTYSGGNFAGTIGGTTTFSGNITLSGTLNVAGGSITGVSFPAGTVIMWLGTTTPAGWLPLDGTAPVLTSANYPGLWQALGGTGANTITLPNISDRSPVGVSGTKTLGTVGGADTATLSTANLPQHNHDMTHSHTVSVDYGGVHDHSGQYQAFAVSVNTSTGYDLVRPFSLNNYATQGSGGWGNHNGTAPIVTFTGGGHTHTGTATAFSGPTGNTGSASPSPVSILGQYLAMRFLIKT